MNDVYAQIQRVIDERASGDFKPLLPKLRDIVANKPTRKRPRMLVKAGRRK